MSMKEQPMAETVVDQLKFPSIDVTVTSVIGTIKIDPHGDESILEVAMQLIALYEKDGSFEFRHPSWSRPVTVTVSGWGLES